MGKKKLSSVLGIDIGSQNIKIVEVKKSGNDVTISAVSMVATPAGMVDHTGVYDTETIAAYIKQACATSGVSTAQSVISVAGQASVLVRTLEVPKMAANEFKEHMAWEISRNIPFAESTIVSDYQAFPVTDMTANNMDVVMAISPDSAVQTLMQIGKKSGKPVFALDVEPLSLARSLKVSYDQELAGKTVCMIEIGHKTTAINMYKDGQLLLPRQVPVGGENLTNAISQSLGVSTEEAERLKIEEGFVPIDIGGMTVSPGNPFMSSQTTDFTAYNPFVDSFSEPAPAEPAANLGYSAPAEYSVPSDYSAPIDNAVPGAYGSQDGEFAQPDYSEPISDAISDPNASPFEAVAPAADEVYGIAPVVAMNEPPEPTLDLKIYNAMAMELDEFIAEVRRSIDYYRSKGGDVQQIMITGGGSKLRGLDGFLERAIGTSVKIYDPFKGINLNAKKTEDGLVEKHREEFSIAIGNGLHILFD